MKFEGKTFLKNVQKCKIFKMLEIKMDYSDALMLNDGIKNLSWAQSNQHLKEQTLVELLCILASVNIVWRVLNGGSHHISCVTPFSFIHPALPECKLLHNRAGLQLDASCVNLLSS